MAGVDCGLSEAEMHNLLPAGIADAIAAYGAYADKNMITAFHGQGAANIAAMPVHMKIRSLILIRLEQAAQYKEVVRRHWLSSPSRGMQSWLLNFYITLLMGCGVQQGTLQQITIFTQNGRPYRLFIVLRCLPFYRIILLIWQRTEAFLDRRLADVARLPKMARPAKGMADMAMRFARPRLCVAAAHFNQNAVIADPSPLISVSCSGL